jgi:hypothetical protein
MARSSEVVVGKQKTIEGCSPHASGHFHRLCYRVVEEGLRHRFEEGALLELTNKVFVNRVA